VAVFLLVLAAAAAAVAVVPATILPAPIGHLFAARKIEIAFTGLAIAASVLVSFAIASFVS
jgi:hypothetical protein